MRTNKKALRNELARASQAPTSVLAPLPQLTESQGRALRYNGEPTPKIKDPCRVLGGTRKGHRVSNGSVVSNLDFKAMVQPRRSFRVKYQEWEQKKNPPPETRHVFTIGGLTITTNK